MFQSSNMLPSIVKRSENGPYSKESDFDMALARRTAVLVKEYGLEFDPQSGRLVYLRYHPRRGDHLGPN